MPSEPRGPLVIIGGHEDRTGERVILREIARQLTGGALLLCAAASRSPEKYLALYRTAFADLGVEVRPLSPDDPPETADGARGVFFSGGAQGRLSDAIRGSRAEQVVRRVWEAGGVIAGTSAGASVLAESMLVHGNGDETPADQEIELGHGLGLLPGVLIDQHFAERGRIGRLATAVVRRPELLGIGIDEDTAIVVADERFRVVGSGGVTVLDREGLSADDGIRLHLLGEHDAFDLRTRRPAHG